MMHGTPTSVQDDQLRAPEKKLKHEHTIQRKLSNNHNNNNYGEQKYTPRKKEINEISPKDNRTEFHSIHSLSVNTDLKTIYSIAKLTQQDGLRRNDNDDHDDDDDKEKKNAVY